MGAMAVAGVTVGAGLASAQEKPGRIVFGVCSDVANAARIKAAGYDYVEGMVSQVLKPDLPDSEYGPELDKLRKLALPIRSCNGFFPNKFRLTGPAANFEPALKYGETACRRADMLGIQFIVFGSGEARNLPKGFDPAAGREQFVEFCRKLGDRTKDCKVTIVLEPLNRADSNILNMVTDGIALVDAIERPNIRLLADFYHMKREREGADAILKAGARLRHCHIAELEGRGWPGEHGEDLRGYFQALRAIGYEGGVSCECRWPKEHIEDAWKTALSTMREQSKG